MSGYGIKVIIAPLFNKDEFIAKGLCLNFKSLHIELKLFYIGINSRDHFVWIEFLYFNDLIRIETLR